MRHATHKIEPPGRPLWEPLLSHRLWSVPSPHQAGKEKEKTSRLWYRQRDGLVQDCSNSSALAMELLQSCTKPLIYPFIISRWLTTSHISFCINLAKTLPVLRQYHGCWCPGSLHCQVISSHHVDSTNYPVGRPLSHSRKDFNNLCYISVEDN